MKNIKGVIFDLDGTLIDSLETFRLAFNHTILHYHLHPINIREMTDFLNQFISLEELLNKLYPGLSAEQIKSFIIEMRTTFILLSKYHTTLKPHVREILRHLKEKGMKIGVATGRLSHGDGKWRELKNLQIDSLVDDVVTAGETKPKLDPASLIKCAQALGVSLNECVFVGDSIADVIAGRRAGVTVIAIPTGVATREDLTKENPDFLLDSLSNLPLQIENISCA